MLTDLKKNTATFCEYGTLHYVLQKHPIITIIISIIIVVKCTAKRAAFAKTPHAETLDTIMVIKCVTDMLMLFIIIYYLFAIKANIIMTIHM